MGKNTLMRKCITQYCEEKGDDTWMILANKLVGNVGIIFTKGDLEGVSGGTNSMKIVTVTEQ